MITQHPSPRSNDPLLWVVGCSITHGVGVRAHERWGQLVANHLHIEPVFLTQPGSSNEWAATQILVSDIRPDDIVLWGLTTPNRFLYYDDSGNPKHVLGSLFNDLPEFSKIFHIESLVDNNLAYKTISYIHQVENFLSKIGCKFKIGNLIPGLPEHANLIKNHFENNSNFFVAYSNVLSRTEPSILERLLPPKQSQFIDLGNDGIHPGVTQHQEYARMFIEKLK